MRGALPHKTSYSASYMLHNLSRNLHLTTMRDFASARINRNGFLASTLFTVSASFSLSLARTLCKCSVFPSLYSLLMDSLAASPSLCNPDCSWTSLNKLIDNNGKWITVIWLSLYSPIALSQLRTYHKKMWPIWLLRKQSIFLLKNLKNFASFQVYLHRVSIPEYRYHQI